VRALTVEPKVSSHVIKLREQAIDLRDLRSIGS
jgi:hypothetical protein